MRKKYLVLLLLTLCTACGTSKKVTDQNLEITFLDDFVIPADLEIDQTKVGGISGIDFHKGDYFLVCDQPANPRFYKADIRLDENSIDTVIFSETVKLDKSSSFFENNTLDLEAIRYDPEKNQLIISSEGSIQNGQDPSIFRVSEDGSFVSKFDLPDYFKASGEQKPRNNGVFEGLATAYDSSAYWAAMELPLEKDGPKPKIYPTRSPVRITRFDAETQAPERQFAYKLDRIGKFPINWFAVNGVTEILEYEKNKFLILERAFSAGYGSHGNTVKIFNVDASNASNTLNLQKLRGADYTPAQKELVFNFKSVKKQLSEEIIDNIEGMCFGPLLPNGNQSLILVSDNNFNSFGKQLNQFILMEIDFKN